MKQEDFKKADDSLSPKQRQVLNLFLENKSDGQIAKERGVKQDAVRSHLANICGKFGLKEEDERPGMKHRDELVDIYAEHKPELVCKELLGQYKDRFNHPLRKKENSEFKKEFQLESPEGTVPLKSPFYVERFPIESDCYQTIVQPGALIPIKAPRQMGKTSLLDRIIDYGRQQGYQTVRLNLRQISGEKFANINTFMRCFCALIRKELPDNLPRIDELWDDEIGGTSATKYLQAILERLEIPLILGLDEVDKVFDFSDIYQYFLPLLRAWHEEANNLDIWENLRLIVVHSTEDYGRLNLNQSPFNVQAAVELRDFLPQEIVDLKERHRLNLCREKLEGLAAIIGGHPYLVRLAFYHLARQDMSMEVLLENAATDAGIYQRHLLRHLEVLTGNTDLKAEFKKVVSSQEAVEINPIQSHKLYSMGLIVKEGNLAKPRCRLYRQYFQERL